MQEAERVQMVNYYELLGVSQNAEQKEIEQAIRKTRRLWNNRANSPDASIRAEAERHVREIAEAERILLNSASRAEYNQQLAQAPSGSSIDPSPVASDWEDEYFDAYERDMMDYAAQLAQRAVQANDKDGRAWLLYGEAIRRGGDPGRAIPALQRAAMLLKNDAGAFRQLGFACLDAGNPSDALNAFYQASNCDPNNSEFFCIRAMIFRRAEMIDEALEEAEKAYHMTPNDDNVRFEYFFALYEDALRSISYNRSSGKHLIINKVQLDYANALLKKMAMTIPQDESKAKCTSYMEEIVKYVVDAESVKGGFFSSKIGYQHNYEISNADTRSTGKH